MLTIQDPSIERIVEIDYKGNIKKFIQEMKEFAKSKEQIKSTHTNTAVEELEDLFKEADNILKNKPENTQSDDDIKYEYLANKHLR